MNDTSVILASMTVSEAIEFLPDSEKVRLKRWGETFDIPLTEFHLGHIRTYQIDRLSEVDATVVDAEVAVLIALLGRLNLARDIEQRYKPLVDPAELTPEDLSALPTRVRDYIKGLQQEIDELRSDKAQVEDQFRTLRRKHNWSRPR